MTLMFAVSAVLAMDSSLLPSPVADASHLDKHWRVVGLPQAAKPLTLFSATQQDGRLAVRVQTQHSYANLVHEFARPVALRTLGWSWRLVQGNAKADLRQRSSDDVALRVCLSFDLPLDKVPFVERQLLRVASSRVGEPLPAATLCYVWDHELPRDTSLDNAFTRRVRLIVLRSSRDGNANWFTEQRDVAADFRRAFGDESREVPPVNAVLIGADSDNTGVDTLGFVADLRVDP